MYYILIVLLNCIVYYILIYLICVILNYIKPNCLNNHAQARTHAHNAKAASNILCKRMFGLNIHPV
nr:MAG TPA: hypothetical protein [Caudoviricetes sp.]